LITNLYTAFCPVEEARLIAEREENERLERERIEQEKQQLL